MKKAVYAVGMSILVILMFFGSYQYLLNDIRHWCEEKQIGINNQVKPSKDFIEILTIYGNHYYDSGERQYDERLFSMLSYDEKKNLYHLDSLEGTPEQERCGNLVGVGPIPSNKATVDDINLALSFNAYFYEFHNRLPDIAWVYYTSRNGFFNLYPWVSSKEFPYLYSLKTLPFYQVALPEHNPTHSAVWTPLYVDAAGKGVMVTLSSPIYRGEEFQGVVSLDVTTETFGKILKGSYNTFLIDEKNDVLATGASLPQNEELVALQKVLEVPDAVMTQVIATPQYSVIYKRGYFFCRADFDAAPWDLLVVVPFWEIFAKAILFTLPVVALCGLLLTTLTQIENRKKIEEKLRAIADTDELTGLHNRHYLDIMIEKELARCDRYAQKLSIVLLDLDRFKRVNDTFGHPVGDEVLIQTARILESMLRNVDILARIGGEEFLIILPETDIFGAYKTAEKMRVALDTRTHPVAGRCTASFGIVEREHGETYDSLYKKVDEALYLAKKSGRNCVVSYETKAELPIPSVYIEWNPDWNSGNEEVDTQHKDLVLYSNQLVHLTLVNSTPKEVEQQMDLLLAHVQYHFNSEEKLQRAIGYPQAEEHANIHKELIEQAVRMKEPMLSGAIEITDYMAMIIDEVIEGHMLTEDIKFYPYLK